MPVLASTISSPVCWGKCKAHVFYQAPMLSSNCTCTPCVRVCQSLSSSSLAAHINLLKIDNIFRRPPVVHSGITCALQVMAQAADHCVRTIVTHCHSSKLLPIICSTIREDRNAKLRRCSCEYLLLVRWPVATGMQPENPTPGSSSKAVAQMKQWFRHGYSLRFGHGYSLRFEHLVWRRVWDEDDIVS